MALTSEQLVGYLRAEFKKTSRVRVWLFFIQLLVAVPAAIAVLVTDSVYTYILAVCGAAFLALWWILQLVYLRNRDAAQAARRAAVLLGGLGKPLSASEISSLRDRLTVSESAARAAENPNYYATQLPSGSARLAEMIEESAFYSAELQDISAKAMMAIVVIFVLAFTGIAFAATPFVARDTTLIAYRIFLAVLVFGMSSDVLGALIAHRSAARTLQGIKARLKVARRDGFPLTDVMLITSDYNAAVESAPESVPYAYEARAKSIDARWRQYQIDNNTSEAEARDAR